MNMELRSALRCLVLASAAVLVSSSCREPIDAKSLSVSIEGYLDWDRVEPLLGPVPGHGDTYRVMYRNETARSYTGAGPYPIGSAIVKEIYELRGKKGKGALLYKAVMRRMDTLSSRALPLSGGWLFTQIDRGSEEFQRDLCWESCHRAAPYVGAFFDHSY